MSKEYPEVTPKTYISPLPAGEEFEFVSARTIYPYKVDAPNGTSYTQIVYFNGQQIWKNTYVILPSSTIGRNRSYKDVLTSGNYEVTYFLYEYFNGAPQTKLAECSYKFAVVENHYPLKKMTVKETIERQIAISEPRVVLAFTPEYEAYCKRAAERLMEIEDEEVAEEIAVALYPSVGRAQSKYDNYTVAEYYHSIGNSLTKMLGRSGEEPIHFYAAMLYLMKQKYKLSNKAMSGLMAKMHNMKCKDWFNARVKPIET